MAITIDLPSNVEEQLQQEWPDLNRHILENIVAEAYDKKRLGTAQVRQLLGFEDRWETIAFLSQRGVYPNYDLDDLEQDRHTLAQQKGKPS